MSEPKLPLRRRTTRAKKANGIDMQGLMNEFEAAEFLGLSVYWMRNSRNKNSTIIGPAFVKLGNGWTVRYRRNDLKNFVAARNEKIRVVDPAKRMAAS